MSGKDQEVRHGELSAPAADARTDEPDHPRGWGACSVSGCPCSGFVQTWGSELCNNCGHKYTDHW